jgi:hypothetical protein
LLSTETFGLKLRFIRSKQSKNGMAQARFDNYKTKRYTFPTHFTGKPVIDASKPRPKAAIIREKEVTQNAKWQMPCILLLM